MSDVKEKIRSFVLAKCLPGESPDNLKDSTPLRSTGIMDSLLTLELVTLIETDFKVELKPDDVGMEVFDTVQQMVDVVQRSRS